MRVIKITLEFDGAGYVGWQVQPNGPSVQAAIEAAVLRLTGESLRVLGSSRTDAGVHALGLVASFRTESAIPIKQFALALNSRLPKDICVREAVEAAADFHPRKQAIAKLYRYQMLTGTIRPALERGRVWHLKKPLNVARMREAAALFAGTHDFTSFGNQERNAVGIDNVRTVDRSELLVSGAALTYEIEGRGFIYNMVRNLVGTLVDVGAGRFTLADITNIFAAQDRQQAGQGAPAHGLYLVRVVYAQPADEKS